VSVADQRSAREPAAQAREEPVLERVEKRKGIQRGPASDAGFQERQWITDDPMANRFAKQRGKKIKNRRVGTHPPDEQRVGSPAGLQIGAGNSPKME